MLALCGGVNECHARPESEFTFPRFAGAAFDEGRSKLPRPPLFSKPRPPLFAPLPFAPFGNDPRFPPKPPALRFSPANPDRLLEKKRCDPAAPPRIVAGFAARPLGL